ncbi:hypothetical protein CFR78_04335 [Komagataeibacter rhaeticus]|nr:hypothetical protein GLUCORHAEAF1_01810 [Komagataeibacter rhaeticus AF1]PYD54203.1 hypothetical protein CFR78_04335 [Komagataeibacter rhaeticus]
MNPAMPIIGMFAALLFLTWGVLHFCTMRDPMFDDPIYITCMREKRDLYACQMRLIHAQTARELARREALSHTGSK